MSIIVRRALGVLASLFCASLATAQTISIQLPATIVGSVEIITNVTDVVDVNTNTIQDPFFATGTFRRVYTVPAGRVLRLTDIGATTAQADTSVFSCIFEIWRGDDNGPTARAWSRVKIASPDTYDRSWVSGPPFGGGTSVWMRLLWGPADRLCQRFNPGIPLEIRFALRGYLFTVP
jgi:hypothetical protein